MAIDRTATYQSSNVGYTRQLTDKIQINLDVTQAHINGTIGSYSVMGTPDSGDEFYYGAQLVGSSLFTDGDMYSAAFRYSDMQDLDNFAVDLSTRYPITQDLRHTAPRCWRLQHRQGLKLGPVHGYSLAARRLLVAERPEYRDRSWRPHDMAQSRDNSDNRERVAHNRRRPVRLLCRYQHLPDPFRILQGWRG